MQRSNEEPAIETDDLQPEHFNQTLTEEYDIVLKKVGPAIFHGVGLRCEQCGTVDQMAYIPSLKQLEESDLPVQSIDPIEEIEEAEVWRGYFICLHCAVMTSTDIRDEQRLVIDEDAYQQYVEHRLSYNKEI